MEEAGFQAGLAKPIRQSQLFDCIANVMADTLAGAEGGGGGTAATCAGSAAAATPAGSVDVKQKRQLRILVAEDNAVNQKVAVRMLEKLGYTADIARNGLEVIRAMSYVPYDLVFMDCQMPEMDGFEATSQIRETEGTARHTHIVAMTANALQGDREKSLAARMDDYISKPVRHTDLAGAIDRLLSLSQAADQTAPKAITPVLLLDESVLQEMAGSEGEWGFVQELLAEFVRETLARIDETRRAAATDDCTGVQGTAHRLKGACKQLGLVAMAEICQRLEDRGKSGSVEGCGELLSALETHYVKTTDLLRAKYLLQGP
jgi:CheY-like chemotaxis protein